MKTLVIAAYTIVLLTVVAFAQQYTFQTRAPKPNNVIALQHPSTWIESMTLTDANWTCPDSLICTEFRVKNSGTLYVSTPNQDSVAIYATDYDIFRTVITKIYASSDSAAMVDMTVFCIKAQ